VNLAARMEQTAAPGTTQLTEHTFKLVAGYFECDDLGLMSVKNVAEPVRVYRVRGEREVRTRIELARERGFTRLVGREHELGLLRQSFDWARGGHGQCRSSAKPDSGNPAWFTSSARPSPTRTAAGSRVTANPTAAHWPMGPSLKCLNISSGSARATV